MRIVLSLLLSCFALSLGAQHTFTRADSLRGALRPERTCYDVTFYDLKVKIDPSTKRISGRNIIHFKAQSDFRTVQVDLFENLYVDGITSGGRDLAYKREGNAMFIDFPETVPVGTVGQFTVQYSGVPRAARRPPWDGGLIWKEDLKGNPWIAVACEGLGASAWWPLKDHLSDEPDSMRITIVAPDSLMAVANGTLRSEKQESPGWKASEWFVHYPINSYNVTFNIAKYVHWQEKYRSESGLKDLDYYVLAYNEEKARGHFQQVKPMMKCFEKLFGEYPFWDDGYALVETPYLGMEHQGAIAYGNNYLPGYAGADALGLGWDYIIIHETGHEWWGNSVSCDDHAELWIHESFCTYSEMLYVECLWDYETAVRYLNSQRGMIMNIDPIVGPRDVNFNNWAGTDMYYKGAWMLHTLRNMVGNDLKWKSAIHDFAEQHKRKVTNTDATIAWFNNYLGRDLTPVWRQYLYHAKPPVLRYKLKKKGKSTRITYEWEADEPGFSIPIRVLGADGKSEILPAPNGQNTIEVEIRIDDLSFDKSWFYGKLTED